MAADAERHHAAPAPELSALAARIQSGDGNAENELLSRFVVGTRVLLRRHAQGAPILVDDLAQDVLSAVLEQLRKGGLRDTDALPAYIRTSALHRLHAELRSLQKTRISHEAVDSDDPRLVAEDRAPGDELDAARKAKQVRELMNSLPIERDRELLRRFYFEEESSESICGALDIDSDHFRRVMHRARGRFREILIQAGLAPEGE